MCSSSGHSQPCLNACSMLGVRPLINISPRSRSTSTSHVLVWTCLPVCTNTLSLNVNKSCIWRERRHVHVLSVGLWGHIFFLLPLQKSTSAHKALPVFYLQQQYRKIWLIFYTKGRIRWLHKCCCNLCVEQNEYSAAMLSYRWVNTEEQNQ